MRLTIKQDHAAGFGYVVIREDLGEYGAHPHAHIRTIEMCRKLIKWIYQGRLPKSEYLQGSCQRLLTDKEFARLRKPKDKYINRGGRRRE